MSWIDEKKRKLETNYKTGDESNLTEKIKLLQKHQALQVSSMLGAYSGFRGGGGGVAFYINFISLSIII